MRQAMVEGWKALLGLIFILTLSACQGGDIPEETQDVATIEIIPANPEVEQGSSQLLRVVATYDDGSQADVSGATWSTNNATVADVGGKAGGSVTVTPQTVDDADVTVSLGKKSATTRVTARAKNAVAVTSVTLSRTKLELAPNQQVNVTLTADFADGSNQVIAASAVTWDILLDNSVASVKDGVVKALKAGNASLSARYSGKSVTIPIVVAVQASVTSLTASPTAVTLNLGAEEAVAITAKLSTGETKDVTESVAWTMNNVNPVSISSFGVIKAKAVGTTTLTASYGGRTATVNATVVQQMATVSRITIGAFAGVRVGQRVNVVATAEMSDGSSKDMVGLGSWITGNNAVATVDNQGQLMGVSKGQTTLKVSYGGKEGTATVNVTAAGFTLHFKKPNDWNNAYAYVWTGSGNSVAANAAWPGLAMTSEANGWYRYDVEGSQGVSIVFNANTAPQSKDLSRDKDGWYVPSEDKWYDTNPEVVEPTYALTVLQGSGSGAYKQGARVNISANAAPTGKTFSAWTGDVTLLASSASAQTSLTMPARGVTLTATYKDLASNEGKTLYTSMCAGCHGPKGEGGIGSNLQTSTLRTLSALKAEIDATMPPSNPGSCNADCAEKIATYIIENFQNTPVETACKASDVKPAPRQLRLLTRREYNNSIRDIVKSTSLSDLLTSANSPAEVLVNGYRNNAAASVVTDLHVRAYMAAAKTLVANGAVNLRAGLPSNCSNNDCFVTEFGKRTFRRPLTSAEKANYLAIMNAYGDKAVVRAFLMSPYFIYRSELGKDADGDGVYTLDQYEVASALSYQFTETMPDDTLLTKAATAGALDQSNEVKAEAERLFALPQSAQAIASFAQQYMEIDTLPTISKDDASFNASIRQAMIKETETFFTSVIKSTNSSFVELLTANYSYGDATLASFYGLSSNGGKISYAGTQTQRAGLFGHGSLLASKSPADESSPAAPIRRGRFIRERVLCQVLPPPPPNVNTVIPPAQPGQTTRERLALHESQGLQANGTNACHACHQYIDPNGFAFENFDPVGKFRTTYKLANNANIDPSGVLVNVEALDETSQHPFANLREMALVVADSKAAKSCFTEHYYSFAYGKSIAEDDRCAVEQVVSQFSSSGYKVRDMMIGVTQTASFLQRR